MKIADSGGMRVLPPPLSDIGQEEKALRSDWTATVRSIIQRDGGTGSDSAVGQTDTAALKKLSELLLGYALKQITPSRSETESGLAFDTWRGMLADAVAHEVASRVDLMPQSKIDGNGR